MQNNIPTPGLFKTRYARKGDAEVTIGLFNTWTKNMARYS